MAWRQNKSSNDNESKFNKFFKKKNESRFNNQIYDRNFNNENNDNLDNKKVDTNLSDNKNSNNKISYHKDFDPINKSYRKGFDTTNKSNNFKNYRSNYRSNFKNEHFKNNKLKPKVEKKKPMIEILREEILNIEKQLSSNKYISKIKKDELKNKVEELNIKLKNEFPSLGNKVDIIPEPKVSCWNNLSNSKIYSENTKNEVISKKNTIKIYEEHVESDYDGNDFIDDDKSCD
jgi:hypothetical protein